MSRSRCGAWRITGGAILAVAGVAAVVAGLAEPAVALVGVGALAVFVATGMLAAVAARPLSSVLGRPLAALLGAPGRLGRENSMRNPRRTAQTAAALMIGMALVSTIAVLGASLSTSAAHEVDSAVNADYLVTGSGAVQPIGHPRRGAAARGDDGNHRLPGAVRVPRRARQPGGGDPRAPVTDREPAHRHRRRGIRDGRR